MGIYVSTSFSRTAKVKSWRLQIENVILVLLNITRELLLFNQVQNKLTKFFNSIYMQYTPRSNSNMGMKMFNIF
jgi:hypothetical protein